MSPSQLATVITDTGLDGTLGVSIGEPPGGGSKTNSRPVQVTQAFESYHGRDNVKLCLDYDNELADVVSICNDSGR